MRYFTSLIGNSQKLDGGAMFGHVPKAIWSKWIVPDEKNRISLACRALLIQDENKNILLETGVGAFFDPSSRDRYGVNEATHVLLDSLKSVGLDDTDIDIVILSHLHFDHAGGLLDSWKQDKKPQLLFPKAKYLVSKIAWERACNPHVRDRASFIPELNILLNNSGRLVMVEGEKSKLLGDDYKFLVTNGHTPGLLHTIVGVKSEPIIFVSDLIPGAPWVHLPVGMGYDRSAELLVDEKREMLEFAIKNNARLFYTHDSLMAMSNIMKDENGKFIPTNLVGEFFKSSF